MRSETPAPNDRTAEPASTFAGGSEDRVLVLDQAAPHAIEWTAERIASGGVVAIPTDTVYGIAASLTYPDALDRIYAIKGRPAQMPLPVLVSSAAALSHLVELDDSIVPLIDAFWPGPLTVVLPATTRVPRQVLGPGDSIGVRLPSHPIAIEVIEKAGGAVACTSANRSGGPPALTALEVAESIGPELDLILDSGNAPGGVASTVVAIDGVALRFIREGALSMTEIIRIWDEINAPSRS
ncbi:MAG: threonylcarbamoyl-AMP synthase [Thermomicrobiales bacterium]|nr:threonylcarbamoyl-AMP synthase [Thermomicrobiales bacterium]MCO5220385.1 L-threonylcarbamoyladenylate synthase [Thermomicrobiales bacterium]